MNVDFVQRDVLLACAPERAFRLFTEHASLWWPKSRRHLGDPDSAIILEASGRFFERATDAREVELGRVREWVADDHLVLDFYPGTSAERPTEVTVTFLPEPGGTRVTIVHRPGQADELWLQRAPRFAENWQLIVEGLQAALAHR